VKKSPHPALSPVRGRGEGEGVFRSSLRVKSIYGVAALTTFSAAETRSAPISLIHLS